MMKLFPLSVRVMVKGADLLTSAPSITFRDSLVGEDGDSSLLPQIIDDSSTPYLISGQGRVTDQEALGNILAADFETVAIVG
mmetsp:Transcript_35874/g.55059  ORF Transcript_35874/g.55059 Transcript_35874/m.55059 type:complete len:82 (-) Transcript_35874:1013-1258(-)